MTDWVTPVDKGGQAGTSGRVQMTPGGQRGDGGIAPVAKKQKGKGKTKTGLARRQKAERQNSCASP